MCACGRTCACGKVGCEWVRDLAAIVRAKCVRAGFFRPVAPAHVRPHFQRHISEKSGISSIFFRIYLNFSKCFHFLLLCLHWNLCIYSFFGADVQNLMQFLRGVKQLLLRGEGVKKHANIICERNMSLSVCLLNLLMPLMLT